MEKCGVGEVNLMRLATNARIKTRWMEVRKGFVYSGLKYFFKKHVKKFGYVGGGNSNFAITIFIKLIFCKSKIMKKVIILFFVFLGLNFWGMGQVENEVPVEGEVSESLGFNFDLCEALEIHPNVGDFYADGGTNLDPNSPQLGK